MPPKWSGDSAAGNATVMAQASIFGMVSGMRVPTYFGAFFFLNCFPSCVEFHSILIGLPRILGIEGLSKRSVILLAATFELIPCGLEMWVDSVLHLLSVRFWLAGAFSISN